MNIVQVHNPQPKKILRIEFMIGNTCNFNCWYCFKGSHEGTHRWTDDMEQLVENFKHLFSKYKAIGKEMLESVINNPYFNLIDKKYTIGWPFVEQLGGHDFAYKHLYSTKEDWNKLNQKLGGDWQSSIKSFREFDDTKWLSEYELLGIYKSVFDNDNYHYIKDQMPIFQHIEQLETLDWSGANVVKFKARPLKGMSEEHAHRIVDYFKRITA